jgi:uncharacterized protein YcnI
MTRTIRLAFVAFALVSFTNIAPAHVTVSPSASSLGAWETYSVKMPNEKSVDTTGLEVRFPPGLQVKSFEDKPGWTIETVRDPSGAITGVRWTGKLPPERFVQFGIIAVNPKTGSDLTFTATQTYADGSIVNWSGEPGSKTPAAHVTLGGQAMPHMH